MNKKKLYNVIFPIWFLLFIPPVIILTLIGNLFIDSLVIIICVRAFKREEDLHNKEFYFESIVKVWLFGFLADFIGALLLFILVFLTDNLLPNDIYYGVGFNPLSNIFSFFIVFSAIVISGFLIYFINYKITFKYIIEKNKIRVKMSLILALVTAPWTFLIPIF